MVTASILDIAIAHSDIRRQPRSVLQLNELLSFLIWILAAGQSEVIVQRDFSVEINSNCESLGKKIRDFEKSEGQAPHPQ